MVATASVVCDQGSSKLAERSGTKTLCLMYPQKENSRVFNQAIIVAKNNIVNAQHRYKTL